MSTFNKLFKSIILENNLSVPVSFPESFDYADYGLEFIFDIMPTFGPEYQWHTLEDLQAIPELINALQNSPKDVIINIADGFDDAADAEENEYIGENMQQPQNFREISRWIQSMAINGNVPVQTQTPITPMGAAIQEEEDSQEINSFADTLHNETENIAKSDDELNISDKSCFGTVPTTDDLAKEVRPRSYRRGLKSLSLANRHKFNQQNQSRISNIKREPAVMTKQVSQQPITKDTIMPLPGVKRPLKLNQGNTINTNTFMDNVYRPSITNLTKEVKRKLFQENTDTEFTTTPFKNIKTNTANTKPLISKNTNNENKKMLCMICKEYVEPKTISSKGISHYECPKCGGRLTQGNI